MEIQPACEFESIRGTMGAAHGVVTGALALLEAHVATLEPTRPGHARLLELLDSIAIVESDARARRERAMRTALGATSRPFRRFVDDQGVCAMLLDDLYLRVRDLGRNPRALERVRRAAVDFVIHQRDLMSRFERRLLEYGAERPLAAA